MRNCLCLILLLCYFLTSYTQKAYFIDGYHGGVYGHYPNGYTQFIVDSLKKNPFWKINLEIEPETWDSVLVREPGALKELQQIFADQTNSGRIEYVGPAYGQSYLYNISGESIIRQFYYGMKKIRQHFPNAVFTTYSSEEPCFTSALPQILTSFGFKYASLKNPNTCWGGYTRAYGGELVSWVGPDGSKLVTVPRYAIESLLPNSTWQTEAWINSPKYMNAAFKAGIIHPVAMTLQDAGWKNGPFIGNANRGYQPTEYKIWRDYFANTSIGIPQQDYKFSQEDVLVSLVWGSQILQKIAQEVRISENKIVMAEKIAALNNVYEGKPWPKKSIDEAWRTLLLSQHHDCWIVPYNGKPGDTWADKVKRWTATTNRISDSIMADKRPVEEMANRDSTERIRVYNTTGNKRNEWIKLSLEKNLSDKEIAIVDNKNQEIASQKAPAGNEIYFKANMPAMGYNTYSIRHTKSHKMEHGATVSTLADGNVVVETDLYRIVLDKSRGGAIVSLIVTAMNKRELINTGQQKKFNGLSGYFYNDGGLHGTSENPANINILEHGPAVIKVEIKGMLLSHPYTQILMLRQGERRIDYRLTIDWKSNIGIGDDYKQQGGLDAKDYKKPFYDDSKKLLVLFPMNFSSEKIYKDAPFDVTESKLDNTFFASWDSIKNNILLHWTDVYDTVNNVGLALFTDHTTSYAHGKNIPLGLTVQYSGMGLWGRNHKITGPTEINYALVPHTGKWDEAGIQSEFINWSEPLVTSLHTRSKDVSKSLVDVTGTGLQVTAVTVDGKDLLIRLFNADGNNKIKKIIVGGKATIGELEELNGLAKQKLTMKLIKQATELAVTMPRFGLRTLRLRNFVAY